MLGCVQSVRNFTSRTQLEWFHRKCMLRSQDWRSLVLFGGPGYRFGVGEIVGGGGARARCALDE